MTESLIYEQRVLPRYFAVMRPTSGGSPSYQICETESTQTTIHHRRVSISIIKNAEIRETDLHFFRRHEFPPSDVENDLYPQNILEWKMKNVYQEDEDVRNVKYWYLPHYFFWNEYHIPVLDFNKRFFLTRRFERLVPSNVTVDQLYQDIELYNRKRLNIMLNIPPQVRPGTLPPYHKEIPKYIVDLIIKDQIEKNNNCTITMTSFKYMPLIGITPCFHIFDATAIKRWTSEHHCCPVCREPVTHVQEYIHPQSLT